MAHAPPLIARPLAGLALLLSGCATVGPDYTPPEPGVPASWSTVPPEAEKAPLDAAALAQWWALLDDPVLSDLIASAAEANLDAREARARVREARARRAVAAGERFPTLAATAAATNTSVRDPVRPQITTDLYSLSFDASWELDVFGATRRAIESAEANLQAAQADARNVLVTLVAEVALNYVEVRAFQARLAIADANLEAQRETYELVRWRFDAGLTTQLDVEQARFSLEQTRAQIPALRSALAQAKNRVAVLLARAPGSLEALLAEPRAVPVAPLEVAVGVPAEVLRRRPDVARAERQLAAQTAQVGVAAAARYPSFALIGSIGLEALSFSNLFGDATRFTRLGGNAAWTLFDAGRLRSSVAVQSALAEQARARYEAAVLAALSEVENTLIAYVQEQERREALAAAAAAAERALELARQQYAAGLIDFQRVLDSQLALLSLQDQLATSRAEVTSNLIRLYKALGGGWAAVPPAAALPAAGRPQAAP